MEIKDLYNYFLYYQLVIPGHSILTEDIGEIVQILIIVNVVWNGKRFFSTRKNKRS